MHLPSTLSDDGDVMVIGLISNRLLNGYGQCGAATIYLYAFNDWNSCPTIITLKEVQICGHKIRFTAPPSPVQVVSSTTIGDAWRLSFYYILCHNKLKMLCKTHWD